MPTQMQIVGGPSREALFDGLRLRHEGRTVEFRAQHEDGDERAYSFFIDMIEVEDGSGESWNLHLFYPVNKRGVSRRWSAYYNTARRAGRLESRE